MTKTQEGKNYNKMNMEDRDSFISFIASTTAFHTLVNEKFDNADKKSNNILEKLTEFKTEFNAMIKELRDGTSAKIAQHDEDINTCKISRTRQNVTMGIGITILTGLIGFIILHISK